MPEEFRDNIAAASGDAFDPASLGSETAAPEPGGKPRRLKKDGTPWITRKGGAAGAGAPAKEKVRSTLDLSSLTGLFVGFHVLLAERTGIPELTMDMDEGQQLQKAVENVMRHYPVDTTQKTVDWASLAGVLAMLYGTRWGAYVMRRHHERRPTTYTHAMPAAPAPGARPNGSGRAPAPQQQPAQQFSEAALVETDFEDA